MTKEHRVSTAYLRLFLAINPSLAVVVRQQFSELSESALEQEFISGELLNRLVPVLEMAGIDSLALNLDNQHYLTSHGPLGFAAMSAPDLRSALRTIEEFSATRTSMIKTWITEDNNSLTEACTVDSPVELVQRWLSEISIAVSCSIIKAIMAHDISAHTRIQFAHPRPKYAPLLDKQLGITCTYSQSVTSISIPSSWGDVRCPTSDPLSYADNVQKCRMILLRINSQEESVSRVEHQLAQHFLDRLAFHTNSTRPCSLPDSASNLPPSSPPTLPEIASELAVSARTLARRLDIQGASYKIILQSVRNDFATKWLSSTHLSVADIADLLGYQEAANFTRAFKSWHNHPPQQWRKLHTVQPSIN